MQTPLRPKNITNIHIAILALFVEYCVVLPHLGQTVALSDTVALQFGHLIKLMIFLLLI